MWPYNHATGLITNIVASHIALHYKVFRSTQWVQLPAITFGSTAPSVSVGSVGTFLGTSSSGFTGERPDEVPPGTTTTRHPGVFRW